MPDGQDPIEGGFEGDPLEGELHDGDALDTGDPTEEPMDEAAPEIGAAEEAAPAGADGAHDRDAIIGELSGIVGADAERLYGFGGSVGETLLVGVESVAGGRGTIQGVSARIAEFSEIEAEFAGSEHLSAEVRVALDEAEIYSIAVIAALDEVGALFSIEMAPEQMADEEFASGQIEVVSAALRELLDLSGLMLFSDELAGAEATLGEIRVNAIEETIAALTDAAGEPMGLRLEFTLALPEGKQTRIVAAAPAGLVARLASLAPGGEEPVEADALDLPDPLAAEDASTSAMPPPPSRDDDPAVHPVRFPTLGPSDPLAGAPSSLDLIMDVSLRVTVELGRSSMKVEEILALGPGSVVELNKLAGEPVDILINDRAIARGEVVVVDENFGVRVTEILSPRSRIEAVGR